MDDLARWLSAQLNADERIARRAGDSFRQIGETGVIVATEGDRAEECATANWTGIAEHIAAWDPARVLREIDAKRALLRRANGGVDYPHTHPGEDDANHLGRHHDDGLLRLLALPYADREGYRAEWAPTT